MNDIAGTHSNASVTSGETKVPFLRRTMNVNRARICIRVLRLTATQPKNARDDWIASRQIWLNDLASAASIFENGAKRSMIADFLRDLQFAQRGARTARRIAETKFGCGYGIDRHQVSAVEKSQLLFTRADNDVMSCVGRGAGRDDN